MEIKENIEIRNNNIFIDAVRGNNVHIFSAYIQVIAIKIINQQSYLFTLVFLLLPVVSCKVPQLVLVDKSVVLLLQLLLPDLVVVQHGKGSGVVG